MRFLLDVRRSASGALHGEVGPAGSSPVPFHGVLELVGLLEAGLEAGLEADPSTPSASAPERNSKPRRQ